jgi:hypothetical protein
MHANHSDTSSCVHTDCCSKNLRSERAVLDNNHRCPELDPVAQVLLNLAGQRHHSVNLVALTKLHTVAMSRYGPLWGRLLQHTPLLQPHKPAHLVGHPFASVSHLLRITT